MKTNLEPGPKRVQSGPKMVQRKRDPGPKLVQCGSKHVQTGPKPVQAHFHIILKYMETMIFCTYFGNPLTEFFFVNLLSQ